jgi:A/G-specific adenine glycosylase
MPSPFAIPRAVVAIPVETRLAASPASGKNKYRDTHTNTKTKTKKHLAAFRRALLGWYDQNRRDLPWRETHDPYRIWLSEIMLQQTRVAAVLEHYRIFLERVPDIEALAAASENAVLAAWSGLGYYRRARSLHQCAKAIVQERAGRFPQRAEELQTLPGIGRYTAAAIASIAFAEPVAVVDGNVERVLRRLVSLRATGTKLTVPDLTNLELVQPDLTQAQIWQQAQALLDVSRPGDFNQAMMELGATVCVPREARCPVCPVQKWCGLRQSSQDTHPSITRGATMEHQTSSPGKAATRSTKRQIKKNIWCVLSQHNGGILFVQRSRKSSLMPGMWELPLSPVRPHPLPGSIRWRTFRHSITITDYTVHVLRNMPMRKESLPKAHFAGKGKWIAIARISQIPITGLTRKILKADGII